MPAPTELDDPKGFVRRHTALMAPPLVPDTSSVPLTSGRSTDVKWIT